LKERLNKGGRPRKLDMKDWSMAEIMNYEFEEELRRKPDKRKQLINNLIDKASDPSASSSMISEALNRLMGKAAQTTDPSKSLQYNADDMLKAIDTAKEEARVFMDTIEVPDISSEQEDESPEE